MPKIHPGPYFQILGSFCSLTCGYGRDGIAFCEMECPLFSPSDELSLSHAQCREATLLSFSQRNAYMTDEHFFHTVSLFAVQLDNFSPRKQCDQWKEIALVWIIMSNRIGVSSHQIIFSVGLGSKWEMHLYYIMPQKFRESADYPA